FMFSSITNNIWFRIELHNFCIARLIGADLNRFAARAVPCNEPTRVDRVIFVFPGRCVGLRPSPAAGCPPRVFLFAVRYSRGGQAPESRWTFRWRRSSR